MKSRSNMWLCGTDPFKTVCDYVHLNPVRAKLLRPQQKLSREGWTVRDLAQRRKGDAVKVRLARRLRQETTMTLSWIAKQLRMGTAGSLANLLRKPK